AGFPPRLADSETRKGGGGGPRAARPGRAGEPAAPRRIPRAPGGGAAAGGGAPLLWVPGPSLFGAQSGRRRGRRAAWGGGAAGASRQAEAKIALQLFEAAEDDQHQRVDTVGVQQQSDRAPEDHAHGGDFPV